MIKPKSGEVYRARRTDTHDIKEKIQLYFDDKNVLLINTKKSTRCYSIPITPAECPLLDHDSYVCLDNTFEFQNEEKVISVQQVPSGLLNKIAQLIQMSSGITTIKINRIRQIIAEELIRREPKDM